MSSEFTDKTMTPTTEAPETITTAIDPAPRVANPWARGGMYLVSRYSLVGLWALMVLLFALLLPNGINLGFAARAVLGTQTPLIFMGLGLVITLAVGEFDLSFAWIYGLSGTFVAALTVLDGWPVWISVIAALGASLLVGLINGLLVVIVGVNSVIVTLGMGSIAYGVALLISNQETIAGLNPSLSVVDVGHFLGLPALFWYGVILVAIVGYIMSGTPLGRHMLFVGSNRDVARLAGVPVRGIRFGAYIFSALLCGLSGVVLSLGIGGFNPTDAQVQLMPGFAAAFLGTVAVTPGRFNPVGMVIAAYFLLTGVFGLQLFGATGWVTNIFYGGALVIAVTVSLLLQRRSTG
jgi:ribose transport system permease protein